MTTYLIGTGGWGYFKIPGKPSLKAYSEIFNFVEVNYTFYKYPDNRTVERWRWMVPDNFVFTVRCHQDLTHKIGLGPTDEAYVVFSRMLEVCRILDAPFLHLLTPNDQVLDIAKIKDARDFLSTISLKNIQLAWEVRSPVTQPLVNLMKDYDIVHSVDLSREEPANQTDTIYTRLFGKGKHNIYQFSDEELVEIDRRILKSHARTAIVTYHGVRMNTDAARFKKYKEAGEFPPITVYTGADSVRTVLREDANFPSSKKKLVAHQGWKVVDLTGDKRVHLSELLSKLPEKTYNSIKDVIEELEVFM
ncbi:MAG: DUF72 domain-containing protein [Candidatus Bathyarchaeota archaeon]|nr:MAG: DUF72 domain-containing protein [Candidatus Bathyarchaeota archaeon]